MHVCDLPAQLVEAFVTLLLQLRLVFQKPVQLLRHLDRSPVERVQGTLLLLHLVVEAVELLQKEAAALPKWERWGCPGARTNRAPTK